MAKTLSAIASATAQALSQARADLTSARLNVSHLRGVVKMLAQDLLIERQLATNARVAAKAVKLQTAEEKRLAAIARTQARLDRLMSKQVGPVGHKAAKASRRASKVVTYGSEANVIAEQIKANRVQKELF
jgi:hypothetical protein